MPPDTYTIMCRLYASAHDGPLPLDITAWEYYEQALTSAMLIRLGPDGDGLETIVEQLTKNERGEATP
jgi:hypothetical protein